MLDYLVVGKPGKLNKWRLCNNAGFFASDNRDEDFVKFCRTYADAVANMDLIGVWFNPGEDFVIDQKAKSASIASLRCLEPYFYSDPWSAELKGKKVLVVSPFADAINEQFRKNRERLFENKWVLPEFELKTITAVQTIGTLTDERFATWFDALDYMKYEVEKIDFDVALIGCGAYSLPLAGYIKSLGKGAVHMGGTTQILFGIKGNRWDNNPDIRKYYNDYWIRPEISYDINKATAATRDYW